MFLLRLLEGILISSLVHSRRVVHNRSRMTPMRCLVSSLPVISLERTRSNARQLVGKKPPVLKRGADIELRVFSRTLAVVLDGLLQSAEARSQIRDLGIWALDPTMLRRRASQLKILKTRRNEGRASCLVVKEGHPSIKVLG